MLGRQTMPADMPPLGKIFSALGENESLNSRKAREEMMPVEGWRQCLCRAGGGHPSVAPYVRTIANPQKSYEQSSIMKFGLGKAGLTARLSGSGPTGAHLAYV